MSSAKAARAAFIAGAVAARQLGQQLDGTPDSRFPATIDVSRIPTGELRLLLKNATANGFGEKPHAQAYRAELEQRDRARNKREIQKCIDAAPAACRWVMGLD